MSFTVTSAAGGDAWDQFVSDLGGSPLISARWIAAVSSPERTPIYLRLAGPSGTLGAIAGLVLEPAASLLGRSGKRLFFYTGPALPAVDAGETARAVEAVVDFGRQSGMSGVVFRSWDHPVAFEFPGILQYRNPRREFVLDLAGEMSALDARMRPQVHRQVRQARAAGLTFHGREFAGIIADLLRLMEETRTVRRAKGYDDYDYFYMPYLSRDALAQLFHNGLARGFSVRKASEIISAVVVLVLGRRAVALLIGTKAEGYRLKAPSLLWYETARALNLAGVHRLNLLGVPPGPSGERLAFFKHSIGCEESGCADGATGLLRHSPMFLLARLRYGRIERWT